MNKPLSSSLLRALLVALTFAAALPAPAATRPRATLAPAGTTYDNCSWDRPGVDPFMGDVVGAVDRYQDIAPDVRERLKARMARREYDDMVSIRRDSITGRVKARYGSTIRDMHFGVAKVCRSVSRAAWSAQMQERGLVYCESGHCILVPTVCRNVSRIARAEVAHEHAEGDVPEIEATPVAALDLLPAPMALDVSPPVLAVGADSETTSPGFSFPGGTGGAGGAAASGHGSFAAGSGGAADSATVAAFSSAGDDAGLESSPISSAPVNPVPEPETWALMLAGLAALTWKRRRR